ncbi:MAG: GAF domain-containing protein [Anaerolineales bacterium]|nr:GAF domain-containing protein [Anaerolineales bacterium]
MKETSTGSSWRKPDSRSFIDQLWRWFIAPSSKITEPDQRRQASLLSGFLVGTILLAITIELITVTFIEWENYTGYRQTIIVAIAISIVYAISRTHHIRLAAILTVLIAQAGLYFIGWSDPRSVITGMFDFMILPLWLGSIYLRMRQLVILIVINLTSILIFPLLTTRVTLDQMLVGPFSFILATSILLIIITRHRNGLEKDRQTELVVKEQKSQHEAARAEALLRVASRLNAQLALDPLLTAISEEIKHALNTPISLVALYDPKRDVLYPAAGSAISTEMMAGIVPLPRNEYNLIIGNLGKVFAVPDLQEGKRRPYIEQFSKLDMYSMAFATMSYEHELIGSLATFTVGERREFTKDELLLLKGLADQAALAIINTRLYNDSTRRLEHLQALRAIDITIASKHDLQESLKVVIDQITEQLKVDAAAILLVNKDKDQLEFGVSHGFKNSTVQYTTLRLGEGMAGRAAQQRQVIYIPDIKRDPQGLVNASELTNGGFNSYYATPLIAQGEVKGVLEIFHRSRISPDSEWLSFLEMLAGQATIAIESATLFENLQHTNEELLKAYDATIEGWSHALDLRDKETEGHTLRVTELTVELARAFGFNGKELTYVRWGSLLHDIGKMGVPDHILFKEDQLTDEEWNIMRQHPIHAHNMLRPIQYLRSALDIPYCHHEKWDGTGYPRGLKGEEIPLAARIFAIVDIWDALTSDRPYRAAWSHEKTLAYIQEKIGSHFDPHVAEVFIKLMNERPIKK